MKMTAQELLMLDLKPGQLRAQMSQDQEKGNTISYHRIVIHTHVLDNL